MTKPYSLAFKENIVKEYRKYMDEGILTVKGIEINNINEFVLVFKITKYSLYSWVGDAIIKEEREGLSIDQDYGEKNDIDLDFEKDPHDYPEETYENFGIELPEKKKETSGVEFGTRFWQFVAKNMGIKNYAIPLKQLKLKIGMELINGTGLVESDKKVREELKL